MSNEDIQCANPECQIAESGKCVEGLDRSECPHFGHEMVQVSEAVDAVPVDEPALGTRLSAGIALSPDGALAILRRADTRVAAIIGPRETGKASLLASLYDLFQTGTAEGFRFARSDTLADFELACHDARSASRRGVPHSERTPRSEVRFYHLDVLRAADNRVQSLLIADRSGEDYSEVTDELVAADGMVELRRAETITFLIDGDRLLDNRRRHNHKAEIAQIAQALNEAGALSENQRVAVVLTKIDLVAASPDSARVRGDFDELSDRIASLITGQMNPIEKFDIAASPATDAVARGTGVSKLLGFWTSEVQAAKPYIVPTYTSARAFGRLPLVPEQADE